MSGGFTEKAKVAAGGAREWARVSADLIRADGVDGAAEAARTFYTGLWRLAGLGYNYGEPVFDREWDVLVVLDACRADLMAEVVDEYDFVSTETTTSLGSASPEWMAKNFTAAYADELAETAYVTGNPYSQSAVDPDAFLAVDDVWTDGWDDELGTVTAETMTDRAIRCHRELAPERMIVHYMQPHHPFVPRPLDDGMDRDAGQGSFEQDDSVWQQLRRGRYAREAVWRAYRENLTYALDSVEVLLSSVDADRVAITADHGNALGEFGLYGHPIYVPIEALKRVPWCVTTARDDGTYDPDAGRVAADGEDGRNGAAGRGDRDARRGGRETDLDASVEAKLRDLGYR